MTRRQRIVATLVSALCFAAIASTSAPSLADVPRARCVEAYEHAQYMRHESKLREAREDLLICSQDACPAVTRNDCIPWLAEVERSLPSIAVAPRDEHGHDLVDAKLSIDGAVQPGAATSSAPIIVDPGPHRLRVDLPDGRFSEESIIVRAGEKSRVVTLVVTGATGAPAVAVTRKEEPTSAPAPAEQRSIVLPVALTALGVVGLGVAVGVGVKAKSDSEDLRTSCSPHCSSSDISAVETKLLISDIGLGVGLVSLAVATYLWLRPSPPAAARAASPAITAGAGGHGTTTLAIHF